MSLLYDKFETTDAPIALNFGEEDGQPVVIEISQAGDSNTKFRRAMERLMAPYSALKASDIPKSVADRILRQAFAEGVVVGWSNVRDRDGNVLEFNQENVVKLFTEIPALFRKVQEHAFDASNFRASLVKSDAGN